MLGDEVEVRLRQGGRALILRSWNVWRTASSFDPVRIRRGSEEHVVPGHLVSDISRSDALSLARELLTPEAAIGGGLRWFIQDLGPHTDRAVALANVLMQGYVMIRIEDDRGQWNGPRPVHPREELPAPDRRPSPGPQLTWIAITVIDADEPDRNFAGARFELRLPDGSTQADALDREGHLRVDDIQSGKCWLELSDIAPVRGR